MEFIQVDLPGILLLKPTIFSDVRGFFMETYQEQLFINAGVPTIFVQENQSGSYKEILRGLHYQIEHVQGKLVRVVQGEVFDVAVDIRRSSPFFGKWIGMKLSSINKYSLWIPPGFAHGFYVLSNWAEVVYKTTDFYAPQFERTLAWNDSGINIDWPLIDGKTPILSAKDANGKLLKDAETYK